MLSPSTDQRKREFPAAGGPWWKSPHPAPCPPGSPLECSQPCRALQSHAAGAGALRAGHPQSIPRAESSRTCDASADPTRGLGSAPATRCRVPGRLLREPSARALQNQAAGCAWRPGAPQGGLAGCPGCRPGRPGSAWSQDSASLSPGSAARCAGHQGRGGERGPVLHTPLSAPGPPDRGCVSAEPGLQGHAAGAFLRDLSSQDLTSSCADPLPAMGWEQT